MCGDVNATQEREKGRGESTEERVKLKNGVGWGGGSDVFKVKLGGGRVEREGAKPVWGLEGVMEAVEDLESVMTALQWQR